MLHGRSLEELGAVVEDLKKIMGITDCTALKSLQEAKKISMTYF
jgi:hypothetical protein